MASDMLPDNDIAAPLATLHVQHLSCDIRRSLCTRTRGAHSPAWGACLTAKPRSCSWTCWISTWSSESTKQWSAHRQAICLMTQAAYTAMQQTPLKRQQLLAAAQSSRSLLCWRRAVAPLPLFGCSALQPVSSRMNSAPLVRSTSPPPAQASVQNRRCTLQNPCLTLSKCTWTERDTI
jgi:hypothetical protein